MGHVWWARRAHQRILIFVLTTIKKTVHVVLIDYSPPKKKYTHNCDPHNAKHTFHHILPVATPVKGICKSTHVMGGAICALCTAVVGHDPAWCCH